MEIIDRSTARAAGLNTYYTGQLCKKGHLAYRYVQSGTCSACINGERTSQGPAQTERMTSAFALIESRRIVSETFTLYNIVVAAVDVSAAKSIIMTYAKMRAPEITEGFVWLSRKPKVGVIHTVMIHPEDYPDINVSLEGMFNKHKGTDALIGKIEERIKKLANPDNVPDVYSIDETFK